MKQLKKITLTLAALLTTTAGAWAQESNEITLTPVTGQQNQWTFTMPAGNVELTPIYAPELTAAFKAGNSNTIQGGKATVTVTESDGTTAYTGATLDENGNYKPLYEGQTITLTAAAGYKFKNVEVKAGATDPSAPTLSLTSPAVGQVIGSDGKNYAAGATLPDGVTKVAMIAYVDGENHGLAIALADEGQQLIWEMAKSTCEAKTPVFSNGTWKLPTIDEWKQMFIANGGSDSSYSGLNSALATAGDESSVLIEAVNYWSSSEYDDNKDYAWCVQPSGEVSYAVDSKDLNDPVRAVLAF